MAKSCHFDKQERTMTSLLQQKKKSV